MAGHVPHTLTGGGGFIRGTTKKNVIDYWKIVEADLNKQLRGQKQTGKGVLSALAKTTKRPK